MKNKTLANWIFWENGDKHYCSECIQKRLDEINKNKEFKEDIDYDGGDTCGYYEDYAQEENEVQCCMCSSPLLSLIDFISIKKKTYVLIISEYFPSYHFRAGQKTHFVEKIKDGSKKHTIRHNYEFWKKRIDKVNQGLAVLDVRVWTGKPYNSKQKSICILEKAGIDKYPDHIILDEIAQNDGLNGEDFLAWFRGCPTKLDAVIYLTDFRYLENKKYKRG